MGAAGQTIVDGAGFVREAPDGFHLDANGNYVSDETGEIYCGQGNSEGCPVTDPRHPNYSADALTNLLGGQQGAMHIIFGDQNGGGRKWPGNPGKSTFPMSWSTEEILDAVSNVVTDPLSNWVWQKGADGSLYTRGGDPSRVAVTGTYNGVEILVIFEPATGQIITAFPPDQK